ncbi:hypothetical protein [Peribacillus tepidiphilus]|uniref:hypothetical protein n=1 Tax=Peribacillus tepidiphilus TaxID=2652445 RepID=UPI0035B559AE
MVGSIWINILFSITGFLIYLLLSYSKYYPFQTLLESVITGCIFFIVAFLFRRLFFLSLNEQKSDNVEPIKQGAQVEKVVNSLSKNQHMDLSEEDVKQVTAYIQKLMNDSKK